jgi:hypothetical protein
LAVVIELLGPSDSNDGATTTILGIRTSRRGANIDAKNHRGNTPLHNSAISGNMAMANLLLSGGADILAVNNDGQLPVHGAVILRKPEMSKYLLQQLYATTRRLPLHELLEDLARIDNPTIIVAVPPLRFALHRNMLGTDDVVEILEYLVDQNPELLSARSRPRRLLTAPRSLSSRRSFRCCSISGESLQSLRQESNSSRRLAALFGMRDAEHLSGHYLHLDEAVPRVGLPMKPRESIRGNVIIVVSKKYMIKSKCCVVGIPSTIEKQGSKKVVTIVCSLVD